MRGSVETIKATKAIIPLFKNIVLVLTRCLMVSADFAHTTEMSRSVATGPSFTELRVRYSIS